jgi:hypothetical protein
VRIALVITAPTRMVPTGVKQSGPEREAADDLGQTRQQGGPHAQSDAELLEARPVARKPFACNIGGEKRRVRVLPPTND